MIRNRRIERGRFINITHLLCTTYSRAPCESPCRVMEHTLTLTCRPVLLFPLVQVAVGKPRQDSAWAHPKRQDSCWGFLSSRAGFVSQKNSWVTSKDKRTRWEFNNSDTKWSWSWCCVYLFDRIKRDKENQHTVWRERERVTLIHLCCSRGFRI